MNKLKAVARAVSFSSKSNNSSKNNRLEKLEPSVGFQLTLHDAASDATFGKHKMLLAVLLKQLPDKMISVPQLDVHLIGARHLPSSFGLKTVEGYVVKVG